MAKKLHVVSILDRSSSMGGTENEVIGAYNAFIEEQKKISKENNVEIRTSLILFDNLYEEVYSDVPVEQTPVLDSDTYFVRGMTAMYDAVGLTINKFKSKKKVIFFIETDGAENSSKEFNADSLKKAVKEQTEKGWDFNFVGAALDTHTAQRWGNYMGIPKTMAFDKSADGYSLRNASFAAATSDYINKD